jgi:acetyl-CoA/propionyl-CoA carboxylase biotin carboxyl carrier protein
VTELVTGRDLVADQIQIASGEPLGLTEEAARTSGHAVEVRLYAEDADAGFLPATGRIEALRWPVGDGVRVDAGIAQGDDVGGRFDAMLAKIVAWGPDRPAAFERLTRALDDTLVLGLVTNLRFLRWLVREPVVLAGEARTDTLDRIWPPDDWAVSTAIPEAAWSIVADALIGARSGGGSPEPGPVEPADPWAGGWRLNAPPSIRIEVEGVERTVAASTRVEDAPLVGSEGAAASASMAFIRVGDTVHVDLAGRSVAFRLAPAPDVDAAGRAAVRHGVAGALAATAELVSPMPGAILAVHVVTGQAVAAGDPIVTLEAMKMEHVVAATGPGHVTDVLVRPAEQVTRGQLLAVIEP